MSGRDRNAPCPCGSGKKYKKCCLANPSTTALAASFSLEERDEAILAAESVVEGAHGTPFHIYTLSEKLLFGDAGWPDDLPGPLDEALMDARLLWCLRQRQAGGQSAAQVLARDLAAGLSPGARTYLTQLDAAVDVLATIDQINPGGVVTLRDLLSDAGTLQVSAPELAHRGLRGSVLQARLFPPAPGKRPRVDPQSLIFPADAAPQVLGLWRTSATEARTAVPDLTDSEILRRVSLFFARLWLETERRGAPEMPRVPMSSLRTLDNETIAMMRLTFDLRGASARAELEAAFAARPEFEAASGAGGGTTEWNWVRAPAAAAPGSDENRPDFRTLATLHFEGETLVFESLSRERAARGRALLEAIGGEHLTFREVTEQSFDSAVAAGQSHSAAGSSTT